MLSDMRSKRQINQDNVAEVYSDDSPVFTLGDNYEAANGQFFF